MSPRETKGDWWSDETAGFDIVKNIAQGWYFDVPENVANTVSPQLDKISPRRDLMMVNLPFLKNYDPARDYVFTMPATEFNSLKEEKKVSYMPNIIDEQTEVGNFTRTMTKVLRGLSIGKGLTNKALTSPVFRSVGPKSKQFLEYTTPGAVASQIAFQPHEERISNMVAEVVQDTPVEFVGPFFEWMQADPDNSEAEERFKMLLESYVADIAFSPIFRLLKGRKEVLKAELEGKSIDEIITIEHQAANRLMATKIAQSEVPLSKFKPSKTASQKILNAKLEDPTIFSSPHTVKEMIRKVVHEDFKTMHPDSYTGYRVFNSKYIEDEGAKEAFNMLEHLIHKEMKTRIPGLDVAKGPKTLAEIEKAGLTLADTIQGQRIINVVDDTASQLGVDKDLLMTLMQKELDEGLGLAGLESRVLAYRTLVAQMGSELQLHRLKILKDPGNPRLEAEMANLMLQTEDALRLYGEIKRIPARTITAHRIKVPKLDSAGRVNESEMKDLMKALSDTGMNTKSINLLAESMGLGTNPLHTIRIAQEGVESMVQRGWRGLLEFYRGMLLASLKTHATNMISGGIETFVVPTSRMAGGLLTGNKEVIRETGAHMMGLMYGFRPSLNKMLESILQEKNILDPLGTKVDGLVSPYGSAISMEPLKAGSTMWHPYNWATFFVNTVGKASRGSLRLLGGEDEFFKQWNYRAQAYSKIVTSMPRKLNRQARKNYVATEMDKYFDDMGRATDDNLRQYSRKITFTEELMSGSYAARLQNAAKAFPPLQFFVPFIRTPTNIMIRLGERTPGVNLAMKTTREMWNSGDPNLRAQVIGNMSVGMAMYGTAIGYIADGTVTGSGPIDPDRNRLWRAAGNQPYSLKTDDGNWISYNRLDPTFMPFVFLASAWENGYVYHENQEDYADMAFMGVVGFMRAVTDRTYLQGLKQMFNFAQAVSSGNKDRAGLALTQIGANVIPSIIGQQYEIVQHFGWYEGAEGFREALTWQEKFMRRAPQLTGYNAVKHNWITGEPIVSPVGYNTGFPVSKEIPNKYIDEVVRMGRSIDPPDTKIGTVELNGPQYAELNRLIGTIKNGQGMNLAGALEAFMSTPEYDLDPNRQFNPDYDDWRTDGVKKIMRAYKDAGRKTLLHDSPELLQAFIEDKVNKASVMAGGEQLFDLHER